MSVANGEQINQYTPGFKIAEIAEVQSLIDIVSVELLDCYSVKRGHEQFPYQICG
jgi:hypothetical protein